MDEKMYVMHHAPVNKRKGEIIGSRVDLDLGGYGLEVAAHQAERIYRMLGTSALEGVSETIITSPLKRAWQTSEIIAARCDLEIVSDDRLKAQNFGILEGMTLEEILSDGRLRLNLWDYIKPEDRNHHQAPGGESNGEMVDRIDAFKTNLLSDTPEHKPLIITHGTVIDALIAKIEHKRLDEVEGINRRFEGRPIEIHSDSYQPVGTASDAFAHIPGVEDTRDPTQLRSQIQRYINELCTREDEKVHLGKLIQFI